MLKLFVVLLLLAPTVLTTAHAAGGDSGGASGVNAPNVTIEPSPQPVAPSAAAQAPPTAAPAPAATNVWKKKWGDLGPSYAAAVKLVKEEKFIEAIKALKALDKPKDPRVLNYLGFSYRKIGKVDKALPYYFQALNIAPEYTPAREYLGEAYVQIKDLEKAKAELRVIEKLCGNRSCEEYQDLAESIQKAGGSAS